MVVDLDADGQNELIASASERSLLGNLRITSGLTKAWIKVLKYKDGRFTSGTLGEEIELALQGITINKQRLLLVVTEPENIKGDGSKSYLLAYTLAP